MGTNFAAISGDKPNFLKGPATAAKPPNAPGRELPRPEKPEDAAGADLIRLSMPGTLSATLLKSAALSRLLARPNSAPAPPLACAGVMESPFVNWPISSGLAFLSRSAAKDWFNDSLANKTKKTS